MTVTYTAEVATCRGLGCFWKLLFRWRGSIYKLLWPNLVVYSIVYFTLSGVYRFILNSTQREFFEKVSLHCQAYGDLIPIAFVLGFYVSIVIKRWWEQYICMPWPDNLAMFVSTLVHGQDDRGRLMRRTIIRYVNLCLVITLRMMSPRVKKRFPTLDHLVEAGFMQPNEKKIFEDLDQKTTHPKYWMPLVWAGGIVTRARKEGRVKDDHATKTLIDELNTFRAGCGGMLNYDWISIPLVYTQVVTLAVYVYFVASLMANQFLDPSKGYPKHEIDLVVPVFTFLQFFFYMGWLKVAESLVNPFGEDDDDFELNWLVDRNLQVSYVIVDEMHQEHPEMVKDQYWDEVFPVELPYTAASKQYQTGGPPVSTDHVEVSVEQAEFMPLMDTVAESDITDDLDAELELGGAGAAGAGAAGEAARRETHPVRIARRRRSKAGGGRGGGAGGGGAPGSSVGSAYTACSLSAPRNGRKSSVLNMLTRMFRRDDSAKDLGSQMGSNVSLTQRGRGLRSSSRMSSMSQSQAQSRTSMARENTFQDEMFRMSDVSLAGSANTGSSQIHMLVHAAPASPLPWQPQPSQPPLEQVPLLAAYPHAPIAVPPRKYSRERQTPAAAADLRGDADNDNEDHEEREPSDGSCDADWHITDNPASTWSGHLQVPSPLLMPPPRAAESYRLRPLALPPTRRASESCAAGFGAGASPGDGASCVAGLLGESIARVVTPSSPPPPALPPPPPPPPPPLLLLHSPPNGDGGTQVTAAPAPAPGAPLPPLPPLDFGARRRACDPGERGHTVSGLARSLLQAQLADAPSQPPPPSPTTASPASPATPASLATPASPASGVQLTSPTSVETITIKPPPPIEQSPGQLPEDVLLEVVTTTPLTPADAVEEPPAPEAGPDEPPSESEPPPPYVPTPAIPVPAASPTTATNPASSRLDDLIDVVMAPVSRRTLHDFHELEPISEHGEHGEHGEGSCPSHERLSVRYDDEATAPASEETLAVPGTPPPPPPPPPQPPPRTGPGDGGGGGAAGGGGGGARADRADGSDEIVIRESCV